MIRLQDIAEMAGVSRTTVSNVINGNTKRVSQKTIDKITAILKEQNYVPHMGSVMLSGHGSRIIGVVLGFAQAHGMYSLQDSFVGELVGTIQMEAEMKGYYVMLIGGENIQNVVDIASRWNVEGLIILGYNDEKYRKLSRKLNKKMVLIDAYPAGEYFFQNVGVDDYSGGYQIGSYLCSCGFDKALFLAETDIDNESEMIDPQLSLDDLLILRERQQKLAATWLNIPEDDRMLLEGKYLLGLSDGELAELAGCKSNSVRMKLTRARRNALKIMLDKEVEWI